MEKDDIEGLFRKVAEHFKYADDSTHRMFVMLVDTTLKFRDMLVENGNSPLTVGETQKALDVFMDVLKTHKMPKNLDKNVHDLVILWFEEIKKTLHH